MKILFLTPYVPSRIRVRPFQLIKELAGRHEIHVIALGVPRGENADGVEEMAALTAGFQVVPHSSLRGMLQSLAALPTSSPMCTAYAASTAMRSAVSRTIAQTSFDIIHVEHLRAAGFVPSNGEVPVVFDSVDCLTGLFAQMARLLSNPAKRLVAAEEAWKLKRHEPKTLKQFDGIVITSESERDALLSLDPDLSVEVVPNGVDTDYFSPGVEPKSSLRIIFSGKMGYRPNAEAAVWFAEQVFPVVRDKWSEAEFVIAGNDPPESVKRLTAVPGITVTGYVPDLRPYLNSSTVSVAPMQVAVGVQNKVLEAMAMGLPVVMSPLAARSLEKCESARIAESADAWADTLIGLLGRPDDCMDIGRRNREFVTENCSWAASAGLLESVYQRVLARRHK